VKWIFPTARTSPITGLGDYQAQAWYGVNSFDAETLVDDREGALQVGMPLLICHPRHRLRSSNHTHDACHVI